ncbi:hypothetical protein PanWU01x14_095490 [Parasponia andersonii]|uniref:Uncharacterized protein n=1 Tax=Parasponia andersonii TaxID=3476 RepID=A0A2P5D538_PARAD|nr:hypothetical protein PanWU01x14_095490 [Parasponia andersonii]
MHARDSSSENQYSQKEEGALRAKGLKLGLSGGNVGFHKNVKDHIHGSVVRPLVVAQDIIIS